MQPTPLLRVTTVAEQMRQRFRLTLLVGVAITLATSTFTLTAFGQANSDSGIYAIVRGISSTSSEARIFRNELYEFVDDQRSEGWAGIDALDVVWLGTAQPPGQTNSPYVFPQAGQPLRMRNWLRFGDAGEAMWSNFGGPPDQFISAEIRRPFSFDYTVDQDRFGLAYGFGVLGTRRDVQLQMEGSIIRGIDSRAEIEDHIFGPKLGIIAQRQVGVWTFDLQGMFMLGASYGQAEKTQVFGAGLVPGALNMPLYVRRMEYSESESSFALSPVGEIRANIRLRMSNNLLLRTDCSSMFAQNFLDADGTFTGLPRVALGVDQENMTVHNLFVGFEYLQ